METGFQWVAGARVGGMGTRSAPMDDIARGADLVHGRPSATHATRFATLGADIKGEALD